MQDLEESLYEYFYGQFVELKNDKLKKIKFKRENLLFESIILNLENTNIETFLLNFENSKQEEEVFKNIRFYNALNEDEQKLSSSNYLLTVLLQILNQITHFCSVSCNYIKKYDCDNSYFLNEYLKRYKSFVDVAVHLNDELENLNVAVNLIYERLFVNTVNLPKFSIYQLFLTLWFRNVLFPLIVENSLIEKTLSLLNNHFEKELNLNDKKSMNSAHSSCNSIYSEKSSYSNNSSSSNLCLLRTSSNISLSTCCEDAENCFKLNQIAKDNNSKFLIENIFACLLDIDCNQNSVFYLNSFQLQTSEVYFKIESEMLILIENIINREESLEGKMKLLEYIKQDEFLSCKFVNRTKYKLCCLIAKNLFAFGINSMRQELEKREIFNEAGFGNMIIEEILKLETFEDAIKTLVSRFYCHEQEIAQNLMLNSKNTEISKIRDYLSVIFQYYNEENLIFDKIHKKLIKENKKRNNNLEENLAANFKYLKQNEQAEEGVFNCNNLFEYNNFFQAGEDVTLLNKKRSLNVIIEDYIDESDSLTIASSLDIIMDV